MNKLTGKIHLASHMSEGEIFRKSDLFLNALWLAISSSCSRYCRHAVVVAKPSSAQVISSCSKWTVGPIAGRNAKVAVYILVEDDLVVRMHMFKDHSRTFSRGATMLCYLLIVRELRKIEILKFIMEGLERIFYELSSIECSYVLAL